MKKLLLILSLLAPCALAADSPPGFEIQDLYGTTDQQSGTVGLTSVAIPTTGTTNLSEVLIRAPSQTPNSKRLKVSFVSSSGPWISLSPGEFMAWSIKGLKKQFWIQGSVAGVEYEVIYNRETW